MDVIESADKIESEVKVEPPTEDSLGKAASGKELETKPTVKPVEVDSVVKIEDFRVVSYQRGETYVGELNATERKHGVGMLRNANGTTIIGSFFDGVLQGPCMIKSNESKFVGQAAANVFHGVGVLHVAGDVPFRYVGQFNRGSLTGYGRMTFADGTFGIPFHEGLFENGKLKEIQQVRNFLLEVERSTARLEKWLRAIGEAALLWCSQEVYPVAQSHICCTVIAAWGIIMLGLMGVFFMINAPAFAIDLPINNTAWAQQNFTYSYVGDMYNQVGLNCFIAAGIYVVQFIFCVIQFQLNLKAQRQAAADQAALANSNAM